MPGNGADKTTLILLRHGETEWNLTGRWQGQDANTLLTERGREQAQVVARRLRSYPIEAIYSSDLSRAFETAQIVGEMLGLEPLPEPGLRESDIGAWTGLTWEDITTRFPEQVAAMFAGQDVRRGGGETYAELHERLQAAVDAIIARHPGQTVLVVTHGAALRSLVASRPGREPDSITPYRHRRQHRPEHRSSRSRRAAAGQLQRHRTPGWRLPGVQRRGRRPAAACPGGKERMSTPTPLALFAGLSLILIGLVYPFVVLWRLNRQLGGEEVTANRQLAVTLALAALVPLTAVLAGFWILVPAARSSLAFTAILFGSGFALVVTLLAGWWINRRQ